MSQLQNVRSTIHFAHDSWTDTGRKHSYFGIYATYVDETFQFKEVLVRLIQMTGKHTGEKMGDGLFDLFHSVLKVGNNLGPGTGDNASNNRVAAHRLADLMEAELNIESDGDAMVGCLCHIANLAALTYLEGEGKYSRPTYQHGETDLDSHLFSQSFSHRLCLRPRQHS